VVIAAITSCTNTSNPSVMMGAGLVARNALKKGLKVKPWVKTSLAPGSQVVTDYLEKAGSRTIWTRWASTWWAMAAPPASAIPARCRRRSPKPSRTMPDLVATCYSGNRNFEGRVSPDVRANYLASPPLVVAYAIAGTMNINLTTDPLGEDADGNPVYLKDIWPTSAEIADVVRSAVTPDMFAKRYADVFKGDAMWQGIERLAA
jgi:aconitate hydratase